MRQLIQRLGLPVFAALTFLALAAPARADCGFDADALSFAGNAPAQARCLLRPVKRWAELGEERPLPPTLADLISQPMFLNATDLQPALAALDPADGWGAIIASLGKPVSRARNNAATAPRVRYFVIHDTSAPFLGAVAAFPDDVNSRANTNNLAVYMGPNAVAHMFVGRLGRVAVGHDFATPWRATKLERNSPDAKGLFVHVELIQPRRSDPTGFPGNDALAPDPGFTDAQYATLARLYIVASARAGQWLIPGFHAAIDDGLADAHDDPQRFDLAKFDAALAQQLAALQAPPPPADPNALLTYARQVFAARGVGGRYMEHGCEAPRTDHPRWAGVAVIKCSYRELNTNATVYLADPSLEQLAQWATTACAALQQPKACVAAVDKQIAGQSGAQFPVDGFVIEPAYAAGGTGDGPLCMLFRDGVTISTASFYTQPPKAGACGSDADIGKPATKAKIYARIASTTREMYRRVDPGAQVGVSGSGDLRWMAVVRTRYQEALGGARNALIDAWVKDAVANGQLH